MREINIVPSLAVMPAKAGIQLLSNQVDDAFNFLSEFKAGVMANLVRWRQ